ncbi:hypothetical protein [Streptomyces sp. WMMB303]|uniref:hypothetical protein n=1 Tax=Streptomyces sp. WMMB303 TaxID=3034154 RepID=UPI0023EDF00E|nr:hypothetical protein [Streptomyces sp. WMMB303]MDF4248989.1 hypothetical protein [Streptomyces sp. WMMB303]
MQRNARAWSRRTASVLLTLVWGALLLVPGTATALTGPGGAPAATVVVPVDREAQHSARTPAVRSDSHSAPAAHDATADAPHQARLSGHPAPHPALPTAVPAVDALPLHSRLAGRPAQERAPPPSWYDPRSSRGPPAAPLDV